MRMGPQSSCTLEPACNGSLRPCITLNTFPPVVHVNSFQVFPALKLTLMISIQCQLQQLVFHALHLLILGRPGGGNQAALVPCSLLRKPSILFQIWAGTAAVILDVRSHYFQLLLVPCMQLSVASSLGGPEQLYFWHRCSFYTAAALSKSAAALHHQCRRSI